VAKKASGSQPPILLPPASPSPRGMVAGIMRMSTCMVSE